MSFLAITAITCAVVALTFFSLFAIEAYTYNTSLKNLVGRCETVAAQAETFHERTALTTMGPNETNGFYYLFDERIDAALPSSDALSTPTTQHSALLSFEFEGTDPIRLTALQSDVRIADGILHTTCSPGDYLMTDGSFEIERDVVGEIEIRIRLVSAEGFQLGWTADTAENWEYYGNVGILTVYARPDKEFHTYRIQAAHALRQKTEHGDKIRKLFIRPLDADNNALEIDYIRVIPKTAKYREYRCGETYETIDMEMRKCIYVNSPFALRYSIPLPRETLRLKTGMGVLSDGDPVTFTISLRSGDEARTLYSHTHADSREWHDASVDVTDWAGKDVEITFSAESAHGNVGFWSNPLLYTPPRERLNVIIVLEDALRADHLSCYDYYLKTTPVKDAFAAEGVRFAHAFSQATATRPSCVSFMTSLLPSATGVWNHNEMLSERYLTLAEIMRNQGFATGSFIQNKNAGPAAGLHQGFDRLFESGSVGLRAETMYGDTLNGWLDDNKDRNFFLYIHLMDPHDPYDPPPPYDRWYKYSSSRYTPAEAGRKYGQYFYPGYRTKKGLYDGEVHMNDLHFETFLEMLREKGLLDNSLIAFMADHGEHIGEHGYDTHCPPGYREGIHVPLIMRYPPLLAEGAVVDENVQLLDLMPTILDVAGIPKEGLLLEGDSLLSLMQGKKRGFWRTRLCISEEVVNKGDKSNRHGYGSLFFKHRHTIHSMTFPPAPVVVAGFLKPPLLPTVETYDFVRDREELSELVGWSVALIYQKRHKDALTGVLRHNMRIWEALSGHLPSEIHYDPETVERLRALGYL